MALSRFHQAEHRAHGVDSRLGATVTCMEEEDRRGVDVRLATGGMLACEMVIVSLCIMPALAPLLAAGADGGNGVLVNGYCRTTLNAVHAISDGALRLANTVRFVKDLVAATAA